MTETATTDTLRVPDALLHYELRGRGPLVVLVAAPMDARSFEPLADLLATDHTVLTTDPRGIHRSKVDDPDRDATPELRADDLARLIRHADAGPAAVLGSSGGAVSVLALAQGHPEVAHTVIAHEPPLDQLVPDREDLLRRTDEMVATYLSGDAVGAWRQFLSIANIHMPDEVVEHVFGGERDPQDLADERFQYEHMLRPTVRWVPDFDVLRAASSRIVVGIGEDSGGELCERTSKALAEGLGVEPTMFPGGHIGFVDDPERFATRLREVLR
ncbi:pimeloyl-ACP methyl ester carboxylesterase [Saccharothrix carnea]|uniref:Pimeloyl-ACP methyl ester carboxylesterase n=1 Tax=Saccharothrix carnea TaxID=1280637 RepID=A0A2P8I554_SACCR|nr:alpha/beta hydrolase [Saccharothrix carnea]PSL53590.1 pimeloyl-ACP methyl ester carboxylesterase [Saccharothrix carnea]